ncbi:MAG: hypoxanthine-guanine phosphoribosyltransferase [Rudaea sp.]
MSQRLLSDALAHADLIHGRPEINAAIIELGANIDAELDGEVPVFLSVMQGGLLFAGALAMSISTDLLFDYVHATRYRGELSGGELHWIKKPGVELRGRIVILADDILDEGYTLRAIREFCIERGAKKVLIAVLCRKNHGRIAPGIRADFCGLEVPDRYVFGFGMDFHEQGRNLPGIYALREST